MNKIIAVIPLMFLCGVLHAVSCVPGTGTDYEVGPDTKYYDLSAVPWAALKPGDSVRIHWRPTPYNQKVTFTASGTPDSPIVVCGLPSADGDIPVISGVNATTPKFCMQHNWLPTQDIGLFTIITAKGQPLGYKPSNIVIDGLQFRDADDAYTYTNSTGAVRNYGAGAAGIYIYQGKNITVSHCSLTANHNGLFINSHASKGMISPTRWKPEYQDSFWSSDILITHNHVYGNGKVGSYRYHNIYAEAFGIVYDNNLIEPERPGAGGSALKDRSAGCVIRANTIVGGARNLDLVDSQNSLPDGPADPRYADTEVSSNTIYNGPTLQAVKAVHFGGDSGSQAYANYRKNLHFHNNTVTFTYDSKTQYKVALFELDTNDQFADVQNNTYIVRAATTGALPSGACLTNLAGTFKLTNNQVPKPMLTCRQAPCVAVIQ